MTGLFALKPAFTLVAQALTSSTIQASACCSSSAGSSRAKWAVTIDDPSTWTRPWTFAMPLTRDDQPFPSCECHEGNTGLANMLSAAQAEERAAASRTTK